MRTSSRTSRAEHEASAQYGRGTGVPHPTDVHVGKRIRQRRLLLGMNQETLAAALGLTFQQVQKYEGGANRVSASRLAAVADRLKVPVSYFFADFDNDSDTAEERASREQMEMPETLDLVRFYDAISDATIRAQFLALVKSLAAAAKR